MSQPGDDPSLGPVITELYGLPLADFTARRNELSTAARTAGDRELSAQIKRLPKPSSGAWLLNQLARHRPDELGKVLGLGLALRTAQEQLDGDEMRRLARVRTDLLRSVLAAGRALAKQLHQPISDTVTGEAEQTLRAALSGEDAAGAAISGQLVRGLEATGLGTADLDGALAEPGLSPSSVLEAPIEPNSDGWQAAAAGQATTGRPAADNWKRDKKTTQAVVAMMTPGASPATRGGGQRKPAADTRTEAGKDAARQDLLERKAAQREAKAAAAEAEAAEEALSAGRAQLEELAAQYDQIAAALSQMRDEMRTLEENAKQARRRLRKADRESRTLRLMG